MNDDTIKTRIAARQGVLVFEIGMRIKGLRTSKFPSMTQQMLADELGLTRAAVTQWESGQATCNYAQALELARIFDVDVTYILFGRQEARATNIGAAVATASDAA